MIVLYQGRRGAGKTMTMVKDALKFHLAGWDVYTNIHVGFPHYYMDDKDILNINAQSDINNAVICVDEIQILLDSRRSTRGRNVDFSHFVQQIRKRNIVLLCTAQFSGTVDLRVRQHTDILAKPHYIKRYKICEVTYIDLTAIDDYDILSKPESTTITYPCQKIFKLFDTTQIITITEKPKEEKKKK